MRPVWFAGTCLALAACSSPEDVAEAVAGESGKIRPVAAGENPRPVDFEDNEERGGGTRDFSYAWPAEVSAIPPLAELLTRRREAALAEQKAEWEEALAEFAGEDCAACKARGFLKGWEVVADTPRFLSLQGEASLFSGGAHGNLAFDALVWDREAGAALDAMELFTSPEALAEAVRAPYCLALLAQQNERRGEGSTEPADPFADCPALDELVIAPASVGGGAFDTLHLLAAPYVAGPYAEGPYTVRLPVTEAVRAAARPEYRAAFAAP
ncbi:hypothetical protein [Erythrobacter sp. HL-111]|uniref:hypothetical protein n=1 Tax=Erythrobacter sp. HL-111 TaxID=1798193 RepID=UPI0006DA2F14|nr:hypothetical protein [Erythrobacter sp. HL-111]KPP89733.1 MAG: hypothetical protein HLUCCO15_09970 [Erythrobacteraceae bacterium HL-111]SDT12150.1 hypothetical protein SAMN04515621_2958 [Erythrobacter sp. HL-111]